MNKKERQEKVYRLFNELNEAKQDHFLGILESLVFADKETRKTGKDEKPGAVRAIKLC